MVIIIASINFASRSQDLSSAIPLLVSFDFITNFSRQIIESITIKDEDAIKKSEENDEWMSKNMCLMFFLPLTLMVGVIIAALVLACLSPPDSYIPVHVIN